MNRIFKSGSEKNIYFIQFYKHKQLKTPRYHIFQIEDYLFVLFLISAVTMMRKYLKKYQLILKKLVKIII